MERQRYKHKWRDAARGCTGVWIALSDPLNLSFATRSLWHLLSQCKQYPFPQLLRPMLLVNKDKNLKKLPATHVYATWKAMGDRGDTLLATGDCQPPTWPRLNCQAPRAKTTSGSSLFGPTPAVCDMFRCLSVEENSMPSVLQRQLGSSWDCLWQWACRT